MPSMDWEIPVVACRRIHIATEPVITDEVQQAKWNIARHDPEDVAATFNFSNSIVFISSSVFYPVDISRRGLMDRLRIDVF